jgi:DNA polymerase III epsilon subunit-like protein
MSSSRFEIMIDIETASTENNALILTIGALKFDRNSSPKTLEEYKNLGLTFYERIEFVKEKEKFHVNDETIAWWKRQSKEAYYEAFDNPDRILLKEALVRLSKFCLDSPGISLFWAHSPNFDYIILENAYKVCNIKVPWKFWNLRDTRTLYDIGKVSKNELEKISGCDAVPHNSLFDCYKQVLGVYKALVNLKEINKERNS